MLETKLILDTCMNWFDLFVLALVDVPVGFRKLVFLTITALGFALPIEVGVVVVVVVVVGLVVVLTGVAVVVAVVADAFNDDMVIMFGFRILFV